MKQLFSKDTHTFLCDPFNDFSLNNSCSFTQVGASKNTLSINVYSAADSLCAVDIPGITRVDSTM